MIGEFALDPSASLELPDVRPTAYRQVHRVRVRVLLCAD